MAGVVGFEPTVHGIKTRGYCYHELSGFSLPFKIVLILLMFLMRYQENHENGVEIFVNILSNWL